MSNQPIGFDEVIEPLGRERFLSEYWTRKYLHIPGPKGRFTRLLPWEELNTILEWHCPPQPQLRLFQENVMVDLRRYIDGPVGALKLNAGGLIAALAQGASLVLDAVHEVAPRVAHLAGSMGGALASSCIANLYAGWRSQRAFDVHWDPHEVMVLQLSGRKRWQVFAPTRLHPLKDDSEKALPPTASPVWEGIMNDGDMLYLPRGWWHVAYPLDEPSLHVSFGIEPPVGDEFLTWWMQTLRRHPELRQALSSGDAASRENYMAQVIKFLQVSAAGDPLGDFLAERLAGRRVRPRLRLPQAPIEQSKPLGSMATRVRLATTDSLHIEQPAGEPMARFWAAGSYWFIRPEFIPAFQLLSGHRSIPFQDMCAGILDNQLRGMLVSAVDTLAIAGVVFKEEPQ
ncbi:MAG TPA: cupin domain-containing protein [Rhizomicrobium sp.]|nr:cupin domain-containing protein [Rhizomicrobium sp.]